MTAGGLLVDKPAGPTSHDVVDRVRRIASERRCGHTGTLDPFATGLMVLLLGRATRLARFVSSTRKTYIARVRFGFATDTHDRTGRPEGPVTDRSPGRDALERTLESFVGELEQRPPVFSAKRVGGKRSYRLAREGAAVALAPVRVVIHELRLVDFDPPWAELALTVSSGTYIRALARDLGEALGTGAHLHALRRTAVGSFRVEDALTPEVLASLGKAGELEARLLRPEEVLRDLPRVRVSASGAAELVHGRPVPWDDVDGLPPEGAAPCAVLGPEGGLVAVAAQEAGSRRLRTLLVWAGAG